MRIEQTISPKWKRIVWPGIFLFCVFLPGKGSCQKREEKIPFGDFEQWTVRYIKESGILGGRTKEVFMIAPTDTIRENKPFRPDVSKWGSSNVMANVMGIFKASTTVFPEKRGEEGWCARLDTRLDSCKVMGIANITVLVSGSIFLGEAVEPVRNGNDPLGKIDMGIPFSGRPRCLIFDYKSSISTEEGMTSAKVSSIKQVPGRDYAMAFVFLQKRWEDKNGRLYAQRVGTGKHLFEGTTAGWVDNYTVPILYGDITARGDFQNYMGLIPKEESYCARNSRGKVVPVHEVGWAEADEVPTHMILMISSGCQGAFVGKEGNSFWVDNVRLGY